MPTPSTTILSLDAQLSLLYANALHYDTELSNLYHELFMKSLKDDDTRKINLDDILKERRVVEDEILTIRMMKKSVPLMQRLVLLGARLIEHGEEEYVNQLSNEYPLPDITALVEKYSDDKYGEKRIKELKRGAVTKVEKPKVMPRSPEPIQKKTAIMPPTEYPMQKKIKGRVSSIYNKEEKLRAKGEAYLELYEKVKQVFSQYCHFFAEVERISYFIVLAMEDMVNDTHQYEALQMHNGYMKSPYMFTAQMVTTSVKRADKITAALEELYEQYKDGLRNSTLRDWITQKAAEGTFTAWRELLFWLLEKSFALPSSYGYYCYDYEEDFIHYNKVHHLDANDDACNVAAMKMLPIYSEYLRRMGMTELADKTAQAFCTEPMYFVCNGKNADGNYLFSNPWHDEMMVSAEGIKVGDELIGKCVYTSLVHFDGLYYVNTALYPKNKGVYTKWAKTVCNNQ